MLLAVDIGNTQTAIGLFEGDDLQARWAFATRASDTADEIHAGLAAQLSLHSILPNHIGSAVIASVVPPLTSCWAEAARRICGTAPLVVGPDLKTGLTLRYDNPSEIGADRIADAVGAIELVGAPVVVVDLGTATNIEVVDDTGAFCGGIIAPGLGTAAADLSRRAARLPMVDLRFPERTIATNTVDAMRSGLLLGEIARIDGLVRAIFTELGYASPVIATGGYAGLVAERSQAITRHEPNLTLMGLLLIWKANHVERA